MFGVAADCRAGREREISPYRNEKVEDVSIVVHVFAFVSGERPLPLQRRLGAKNMWLRHIE